MTGTRSDMQPTRRNALLLWLVCTPVFPILWMMQGLQAIFGNPERSVNMALAIDSCGNALFGGDFRMTISERTGLALIAGKRWGRIAAPVIDFFFGENHCRIEGEQWLGAFGEGK
jgi:hypothetical protein